LDTTNAVYSCPLREMCLSSVSTVATEYPLLRVSENYARQMLYMRLRMKKDDTCLPIRWYPNAQMPNRSSIPRSPTRMIGMCHSKRVYPRNERPVNAQLLLQSLSPIHPFSIPSPTNTYIRPRPPGGAPPCSSICPPVSIPMSHIPSRPPIAVRAIPRPIENFIHVLPSHILCP